MKRTLGPSCRSLLASLALVMGAGPACILVPGPAFTVGATAGGLEYGFDRPGYDYKNFELSVADPRQCQNACYAEPQCQSFSYTNPGVLGPNPHCWLKTAVAPAVANNASTSGVKAGYVAPAPLVVVTPAHTMENDTNRYGSDFNGFDVPSADPAVCQDACLREPACRAFTLVRPGIQGSSAHCWLKNTVPPPTHDACCISGMK